MSGWRRDLRQLLRPLSDGCTLALPADYSGVPMAATAALLRRGVRDLRLLCVPVGTLQADLLIGAGAVASVEAAAVSLGEYGLAPRFGAAVSGGEIEIIDSTCPAVHAALQAAEKGIPYMPLRGLIGSDVLAQRRDWRLADNPFVTAGDPIVLLPAIAPDVALFHAPFADAEGNVWLGRRRELITLAHAARCTLVTVERRVEQNLFDDERLAAGALPALYVDGVALAPGGVWPLAFADHYPEDGDWLRAYATAARESRGFARCLDDFLARAAPLAVPA